MKSFHMEAKYKRLMVLSKTSRVIAVIILSAILATGSLVLNIGLAVATHDSYASVRAAGVLTGTFYCPPMGQPPMATGNFDGVGGFGASENPNLDDDEQDGALDYGAFGFHNDHESDDFNGFGFAFLGDEIDNLPTISSSGFKLSGIVDEGIHCWVPVSGHSYTIMGECSTDNNPVNVEVKVSSGASGTFTGVVECHLPAGSEPLPDPTPPVANDDSYSTSEDTTLTVAAEQGVLANDNDADGDSLTATLVTSPSNGELTLNSDGSFSYAPTANFHGTDSFTYNTNDGTANSNTAARVTITVNSVNDLPIATDDTAITDEDTPVTVDVLANDVDADEGDALTVSSVSTPPSSGTATINQDDNTITYAPNSNFNGQDSFIYEVSDGNGGADSATVTITVNPVADIPDRPTITSPQDGTITNDNTPTIEGTADDATVATTIEVFADGTSLGTTSLDSNSGSSSWSFTPSSSLSDGAHKITATATNDEEEGATSEPSDAVTITIDTKAPTVTGTADREPDSENGYYTESVTITWQGDDGADGSGIGSCDDPTTYSGPDGTSIELTGECTDYAGNTGQGTFTLSYDGTGPEVTITKAEDEVDDVTNGGTTKSNQIEFRFTASDSASGLQSVQCSLDGGIFSDCTSPVEYTKLKRGTHTFEVKATDQVGHVGTDDFTWTIEPQQQRQQQQQQEVTATTEGENTTTAATTTDEEEEEGIAEQGREGGGADRGRGTDDGSGDPPKR